MTTAIQLSGGRHYNRPALFSG